MTATHPAVQVTTAETFGLPAECAHLIAKLRAMTAEQRQTIIHTKERNQAA